MRFRISSTGKFTRLRFICAGMISTALTWGCTVGHDQLFVKDLSTAYATGTIIRTGTAETVRFDEMASDLATVQVVYVGEQHASVDHHAIQLQIIRTLHENGLRVAVGMEMFDRSYQAVLDRWSAGQLDESTFLKMTHWYANWRYDYGLYRDLLNYIRQRGIRLIALNLPFHVPPKIRVGGIDYLSACDREFLADEIDTGIEAHRLYVRGVFEQHGFGDRVDFDDFYLAQCAWEDTMAESIADQPAGDILIALMGNGHIQYKYGVPVRAFKRNGAPFRTIYPARAGSDVELSIGDYIWVTP
jgi:uncharacterized iron-regulated protein